MKNTIRKLCSVAIALVLLLSCTGTALAADGFNAGIMIEHDGDTITVTVAEENNDFLAAHSPRLSVVCDFDAATVTLNGETIVSFLKDGMISFPVKSSGTYVITGTVSEETGCPHPDENGDNICDSCECYLGAAMEGAMVGLKDSIHMKSYFTLSDEVLADPDAYLQITRPDGSVERHLVSEATGNNGYYVFTAEFSAKEMTDVVALQIVMRDGSSEEYHYSLRDYADIILSEPIYSDKDRTMVKAMLFYGSYAQQHFGYKTDALAGEGLSLIEFDLDSVTADTLAEYADNAQQGTEKVTFMGSSLLLKSNTILRLFFKVDPSVVNQVRFTYKNQPLQVHQQGSYHYVDIAGIAAKNLCDDVSVVINDGTEATVTYNPMSYCYNVLANPGTYAESLRNVVKALYLYSQAARAYFNA